MSRNGSGTYTAPTNSWNPAVSGNAAVYGDWQAVLDDLVAAMTASVAADGQTVMSGNLQMGGNILTGLGVGSASGHSAAWQQLFNQGTEIDVASAATTDIGVENSNFLSITGTTTITSLGTNYKGPRFIRFTGILTLTHNATTLVLPSGANIVTAAGDSLIAVPKASAGTANGWQILAYQRASGAALVASTDYLNTTRSDIASATTVDLTAGAPSTRNINITGTTTITGFTVAIGQLYFVRFNAALTLTNNAAIVTQTGANITTAAGDTCILRATASNTVEVLSYVGSATTTQRGEVELATSAETITGTDTTRAVTPAGLAAAGAILTQSATQATTSGTSIDFTGIPSTAKIIHVTLGGVSTNGTSPYLVQLGDSGGIETSGYESGAAGMGGSGNTSTQGLLIDDSPSASSAYSALVILSLQDAATFRWVMTGSGISAATSRKITFTGMKATSATLDRIRLTTANGTDAFDAGSISIKYM